MKSVSITKMWKFYFWPIVWLIVLVPSIVCPFLLSGVWLIISRVSGILLFIASMFLASSGGRTLAKYAHKEEHQTFWPDKFTTIGVFGCMRHPMHFGLALFPIAVSLIAGYIPSILASGWGVAATLWFVLVIEEKDTLQKYGVSYTNYMKKVPPFSIKIKCIKEVMKIWKKN